MLLNFKNIFYNHKILFLLILSYFEKSLNLIQLQIFRFIFNNKKTTLYFVYVSKTNIRLPKKNKPQIN